VAGRVEPPQAVQHPLPQPGEVKTYLLTCVQTHTHLHSDFWRNLQAYARHLDATILAAAITYDRRGHYHAKAAKTDPRAAEGEAEGPWITPEVAPYVVNVRQQLAPTLIFCAELNIIPTRAAPLSGLLAYSGASSMIAPHTTIALQSVPTAQNARAKMCYTTGAVTLRHYLPKIEGQKAEFHHSFGALLVEVDSEGRWWARQLNAISDGSFQDLTNVVRDGAVSHGHAVDTVVWGDIHARVIDPAVAEANWRAGGGVLDVLRPAVQVCHDLFDFSSGIGHHEQSLHARALGRARGARLELEIQATADLMWRAHRPWCETVVVASNHDAHPERWLEEADFRSDPDNAELFCNAWSARLAAIRQDMGWAFLPWALGRANGPPARFLSENDSYLRCGIELAWHGHLGANGSRAAASLYRTGRKCVHGHTHSAVIVQGGYAVGVCQLSMSYARGPSSWSVTHCVIYPNGKRALLTSWDGRLWARGRGRYARAAVRP
jgi:hypothetical protein